jgi:hypothetical protein
MIAMISGHLDLTQEEFDDHYRPYIIEAIVMGHDFVVGDAKGADQMAQACLKKWQPILFSAGRVTVYHMLTLPRHNAGFKAKGGYQSNSAKDAAMTAESDYDILYIRPDKHSSQSGRVSGTEANFIRRKAKTMGQG